MDFWGSYGKILQMKYVFFIKDGKVVRLSWDQVLKVGEAYVLQVKKIPNYDSPMKLGERRMVAEAIMKRYSSTALK